MELEKNTMDSANEVSVDNGVVQVEQNPNMQDVNMQNLNAQQMQNIQQMQNMQQMQMQQMQMQQMQMQMQMMKKGNLKFGENLKGMFVKPIDTTKKVIVENNMAIAMIFIAAQAIISSLIFAFLGSGEAFGIALALSLASTFLFALITFIALKTKGVNISYANVVSIVASKSVIVAAIDAVASFCLLFNSSIAFSIYFISSIVGLTIVVATFLNIIVMEDNSKAITIAVVVGIYYIVMMFISYEVAKTLITNMISSMLGFGGLGGLGSKSSKGLDGLSGLLK